MSYDVVLVMTWTPSSDSGDVAFECNKHWFSSCDDNHDDDLLKDKNIAIDYVY